jgi:hypothetical protein
MTRNKLITIFAVTAMAAMMQTAQATVTLADLAAGETISIGDKTFSGFSYTANGLTSFDASQIDVNVYQNGGVDYLTWSGSIALASSGTAVGDLKLNYIVSASAGVINMIDQAYTGSTVHGGLLTVDETVATGSFGGTIVGSSHLELGDLSDPPAEANDLLNIVPPQLLLYVTKDITLSTIAPRPPGALVTISQVTQSFHQIAVPEPTTIIAGALLLLPFGASTLRILRKNRR